MTYLQKVAAYCEELKIIGIFIPASLPYRYQLVNVCFASFKKFMQKVGRPGLWSSYRIQKAAKEFELHYLSKSRIREELYMRVQELYIPDHYAGKFKKSYNVGENWMMTSLKNSDYCQYWKNASGKKVQPHIVKSIVGSPGGGKLFRTHGKRRHVTYILQYF